MSPPTIRATPRSSTVLGQGHHEDARRPDSRAADRGPPQKKSNATPTPDRPGRTPPRVPRQTPMVPLTGRLDQNAAPPRQGPPPPPRSRASSRISLFVPLGQGRPVAVWGNPTQNKKEKKKAHSLSPSTEPTTRTPLSSSSALPPRVIADARLVPQTFVRPSPIAASAVIKATASSAASAQHRPALDKRPVCVTAGHSGR